MPKLIYYHYGSNNNLYAGFFIRKKSRITLSLSFSSCVADIVNIKRKNLLTVSFLEDVIKNIDAIDFVPSKNIIKLLDKIKNVESRR